MSYQPLHQKYRPQTFAELVGQDAISSTLTNAIVTQRIAPAYLFTGPRGTGKTSSARIFAKSLNCQSVDRPTPNPCGKCEVCRSISKGAALDVIEIDAASNTGVDNIREIIEKAQFAALSCRYKVYVIDECHMLSTAAFNALLKTLEEPPKNVIFILATTDPQKVLPTIISRTQRFDYRRIELNSMVSHLKNIASQENIQITDEAITIIAQMANGGLRDAQSLLDQLSLLSGEITPQKVWDLVGAVPEQDLLCLINAIESDNSITLLEQSRRIMDRGREPLIILQNLANFYINLLIAKTAPHRQDLVQITNDTWNKLCELAKSWSDETILQGQQHLKNSETKIKNTSQPRLWLEISLLGLLPSALRKTTIHTNIPSPQADITGKISKTLPKTPPSQNPTSSPSSNSTQPSDSTQLPTQPPTPSSSSNSNSNTSSPIKPSKNISKSQSNSSSNLSSASLSSSLSQPSSNQSSLKNNSPQNLVEIWNKFINQLPNFRQALIKPHAYLMIFEGEVVVIGVRSQGLLIQVKRFLDEFQEAFYRVLGYHVKIYLKLGDFPESSKKNTKDNDLNSGSSSNQNPSNNLDSLPKENSSINQQSINQSPEKSPPHPENIYSDNKINHKNYSQPRDINQANSHNNSPNNYGNQVNEAQKNRSKYSSEVVGFNRKFSNKKPNKIDGNNNQSNQGNQENKIQSKLESESQANQVGVNEGINQDNNSLLKKAADNLARCFKGEIIPFDEILPNKDRLDSSTESPTKDEENNQGEIYGIITGRDRYIPESEDDF